MVAQITEPSARAGFGLTVAIPGGAWSRYVQSMVIVNHFKIGTANVQARAPDNMTVA